MVTNEALVEKIDAVLPQTQCQQCGFSGCKPYADAIVSGDAEINQCPPGDVEGIQKIADILGIEFKPLNTRHGVPKPKTVALVDESSCIGCTFCLQSCPVDAIVGAPKQMHTIVTAECTGCELCVAPCPVDCISMIPDTIYERMQASEVEQAKKDAADLARLRHAYRLKRLAQGQNIRQRPDSKSSVSTSEPAVTTPEARKKQIVQAAIKRAMAARAEAAGKNDSVAP